MPVVTPALVYNEPTRPNYAPTSGYDMPAWLQQSGDTRSRPLSESTSSSPPMGMRGYKDPNYAPSTALPDYMSQEGGTSAYPSNAVLFYGATDPHASFGGSRAASDGLDDGRRFK
jgi:hypothetical protein